MSFSQTVKHDSHLFTFKQQNPDCYYIGVTYSFLAENSNKSQEQPLEAPATATALPTFNTDHLYFTPTFVLTTDKDYYRSNISFEKQKFQDKIQQAQNQLSNSDINLLQPNFNFCQICKKGYQEYRTHVLQKSHVRTLGQAVGNRWIVDVCGDMARKEKQIKKQQGGKAEKTQPQRMTRVKKKTPTPQESSPCLSKHCNPTPLTHTS